MKLLLEITAADQEPWEEECDGASIDAFDGMIHKCENGEICDSKGRKDTCHKCHGTGTVRKVLVGMVEFASCTDCWVTIMLDDKLAHPEDVMLPNILFRKDDISPLIKAHRSGDLPPELYQSDDNPHGLREEIVDEKR